MSETVKETDDSSTNEPLHISIADKLAHEILDGIWISGTSKKLEDIQSQFGISRTVAREAARLLESLRCVQLLRGTGIIAMSPETWANLDTRVITWKLQSNLHKQELAALTELRLVVEPAAAAGCASRSTIEARTRIAVTGHEMIKAARENRLKNFHTLDTQFHTELLKNSGNPLFAELSTLVEAVLRGRVDIGLYPSQPKEEALQAHEQVAQAVLEGNAANAAAAMKDIVSEVNTALGLSAI
ncbi:FadR/GntR family transcriptional regulator [Alloscardovia venturai]|uniref:FadR/GntR family transcriptional regulator n=1 Tax=Alloscardovia venturai TaxID=1769421 RepID=A0ABW2Y4Q7_9BIFI